MRLACLTQEGLGCKVFFLQNLTGTGYFDMFAYAKFNGGQMSDYIPTDDEIALGFSVLPEV